MTYRPYELPRLVLQGAPFEIGKEYGELERVRIRLHVVNQQAAMAAHMPQDPQWWKRAVFDYLPPYEELAPHFVEEMHGLARGADLTFEEVLLLNVRDELVGGRPPEASGRPWLRPPASKKAQDACTSFGCAGPVTLDGHPILGQTKDTAALSQDLYVVLAMYQQGRPDLLQMPYAGELGVFGLSSAGMSCFGNSIYVRGPGWGRIPWSLFRRLVLEAENLEAVLALVEKHGIRTVGNLTVGDASGRAIAIENTDHGPGIVEAQDGILVHANHICTPELVCHEDYAEPERAGSQGRQVRLRAMLEAERGRLTAPLAMRALCDHDNYPRSICRHPSTEGDIQTTAALVVEPARGLLHVIRGQPCRGWPATYSL